VKQTSHLRPILRWSYITFTEQKCVFSFSLQLLSETFLIPRRIERDMRKKNVYWSSCEVPDILARL
jgi:hypothetical protein